MGVEGINWLGVASVTGVATILSVATSIGNASFTAGR
ncbi:holin [Pseudoclavibacter helvolus]